MIYRVLGELVIGRPERALTLPGGHTLVVLAALLINANRRISKAELLRAAWGDTDVSEAQLHKAVAAIRALLDQVGRRSDLVTHSRQGYEMRLADDDLDMLAFRRAVRRADQAKANRQTDEEIEQLRDALRMWRGPRALSNVPSNAFQRESADLEHRRKRAAVRLFDLEITRHGYDRVLDDLRQFAAQYPSDRRLCEQLMIVAYRSGHPADAIAAYEQYAAALADQTGGGPDPALRMLCYAIGAENDEAIAAAQAAVVQRTGISGPVVTAAPRQLPPEPADFVGRLDLLAEASWLVRRQRDRGVPVVVISGPAGIGKTALALRVAHLSSEYYRDGQLYAELRDAAGRPVDPAEVLAQFLRALGVRTAPETGAERAATYRTLLAERRVLVLLDDAADGAQIRDLIPANPACAVVVTARQRLPEVAGAHHVPPLEPLDRVTATDLFLRVVRGSGIDVRHELDAVQRVVTLCGGLPLALRIAGALRVHQHPRPTAELADRLARLGPEALEYGQQSVARAIGAGFDRLDPNARRLFLGLGLLRLPAFGLWTAAALLDGTGVDPAAALSQLAANSMIEPVEADLRYRFHDLTREYARRRGLVEYGDELDRAAAQTRAYRALLTLERRAHAALYGGPFEVVHSTIPDWPVPGPSLAEVDADPLAWFDRERAGIRAAVDHTAELGLIDVCWDLAVSAHEYYTVKVLFDDWYSTHTVALRACRDAGDTRGEGIVLACLGQSTLVNSHRFADVAGPAELSRAADLLAGAGDRHGRAIALRTLANALRRRGQLRRPLALFREALDHYQASGDTVGRLQALRFIGHTHLDLGDHAAALTLLRSADSVARDLGEQRLQAQTRYWLGQAQLAAGDLDAAEAAFTAVLAVYPEPAGLGHAYAAHGLGDVAVRRGDFDAAQRRLHVAGDLAHRSADAVLEGRAFLSLATLHAAMGRSQRQISVLETAATIFEECGAAHLQAKALAEMAGVYQGRNDQAGADAAWRRVEALYAAVDLPREDRLRR